MGVGYTDELWGLFSDSGVVIIRFRWFFICWKHFIIASRATTDINIVIFPIRQR